MTFSELMWILSGRTKCHECKETCILEYDEVSGKDECKVKCTGHCEQIAYNGFSKAVTVELAKKLNRSVDGYTRVVSMLCDQFVIVENCMSSQQSSEQQAKNEETLNSLKDFTGANWLTD